MEFFNGPTKLGEDLISPYSFVWNNAPAGNYSLTASATDNQNAVTLSSAIAITIGNEIPPSAPVAAVTTEEITVYPNPATDSFTLHYTSTLAQQSQIAIFDMASRLIRQMSVPVNEGQNDIVVDTLGMGNGVYVVLFLTSDGKKYSTRLIILGK